MISQISSVVAESILIGRPTVLVDPIGAGRTGGLDAGSACHIVRDARDLPHAVERVLVDEDLRRDLVAARGEYVEEHFFRLDGGAGRRGRRDRRRRRGGHRPGMSFDEPDAGTVTEAQAEEAAVAGRGYSLKQIFRGAALYSVSDIFKALGFLLVPVYTRALSRPTTASSASVRRRSSCQPADRLRLDLVAPDPLLRLRGRAAAAADLGFVNFMMFSGLAMTFALALFWEPVFDAVAGDVPF